MRSKAAALALIACAAPLQAQTRCTGGAEPRPDYGISLACENCTIAEFGRAESWSFGSEPRVTAVQPKGAAQGALEPGDEIVRVNGYQITTSQGAAAFATPVIGRTTVFTVRRAGSLHTAQVKAGATCPETSRSIAVVSGADEGSTLRASRMQAEGAGWLGIGFGCSDCGFRNETGKSGEWQFSDYPDIYSIDASSPAYRAGLRRGDVVTHVDGVDVRTKDGGRRLAAIRPGQQVRLTFRRDGKPRTVTIHAAEQPARTVSASRASRSDPAARVRELLEVQERLAAGAQRLQQTEPGNEQLLRRLQEETREQQQALRELGTRLRTTLTESERSSVEERLRTLREHGVRQQQQLLSELLTKQQEETRRIQELQRQLQGTGVRVPLVSTAPRTGASGQGPSATRRLSYSGSVGNTDVEVRGPSPVVVTQEGDVITIQVGENTVKITQRGK